LSLGFLGLSKWFWMGLIAAGALGFSDSISVTIRRTIVQMLAPDNMRGRASSFLTIFAQATNALGAVIAGAAAALVGASNALLLGSMRRDYSRGLLGHPPIVEVSVRIGTWFRVSGVSFGLAFWQPHY
jgi:MFS family permease